MQDLMIQVMNQFGYLGVCFLIAVENIFPPIPSEVILTFGGFMTTYTRPVSYTHLFSLLVCLDIYCIQYSEDQHRKKE